MPFVVSTERKKKNWAIECVINSLNISETKSKMYDIYMYVFFLKYKIKRERWKNMLCNTNNIIYYLLTKLSTNSTNLESKFPYQKLKKVQNFSTATPPEKNKKGNYKLLFSLTRLWILENQFISNGGKCHHEGT